MQFLIVDILELVIERTILGGYDFCHSFMQDQVCLVINAHEFALKRALVLGHHSQPLADVLLLDGALGFAWLALEGGIILLHRSS